MKVSVQQCIVPLLMLVPPVVPAGTVLMGNVNGLALRIANAVASLQIYPVLGKALMVSLELLHSHGRIIFVIQRPYTVNQHVPHHS